MSIYTKTSQNIYFLNDKNIASSMNDTTVLSNALPSFDIVSAAYDEFEELCVDVKNNYVKKAGDTMTGNLSIASELIVDNNSSFKQDVTILKNLTQGKGSYVNSVIDRGIALGVSAIASQSDSFVWNGDRNNTNYTSLGGIDGTFNINPEYGTKGFYIGQLTLSSIIHNDILLSANSLTTDIYNISNELCLTVNARRTEDKAELSNTLSTYSNELCTSISNVIDEKRKFDKAELSNTLSTYSNELCTSISSCINNSKFAICKEDNVKFWYDSSAVKHALWLELSDMNGDGILLSVDTTEFIKDRILKKAEVCYNEDTPPELVLRLYWNNIEPSVGEYTDIKIKDLAKIYKAGKGIHITPDLSVSVIDYDGIVFCLNDTSSNVDTLSNTTIPAFTNRVNSLEDYTRLLSSTYTDGGIIATLSVDLHTLSTNISTDVNVLSNIIVAGIRRDTDSISVHANSLQAYANQLSGVWGDIPFLSSKIDDNRKAIRGAANFCGHVDFSKYHPDWLKIEGATNTLSSFFKYRVNRGTENAIKNGNIYEILFTVEDGFSMSDPVYAADQYWEFDDELAGKKFRIAHKDYIAVYIPDGTVEIPIAEINAENVHIISDTRFYEHYQLSNTTFQNMPWLSGGNTNEVIYNKEISSELHIEEGVVTYSVGYVKQQGHAFGGNNDFNVGNNRFHGRNYFSDVNSQTDFNAISVRTWLSSSSNKIRFNEVTSIFDVPVSVHNDVNVNGVFTRNNVLTVENEKVDIVKPTYIANTLSVNNNLTVTNTLTATQSTNTVDIVKLSAGQLTSDWLSTFNSTGYSLADLSTHLSNKIWIDDQVCCDIPNHTSDLSIIKIKKDDFDALVADETKTMSADTIYFVDSNYIDAYGQAISNVIMSSLNETDYLLTDASCASEATNKRYVDALCSEISSTVSNKFVWLSGNNNDSRNHSISGNNDFIGRNNINILSVGTLSVNFANTYDFGSNNTKYNTLNAFETSVELSTLKLSAYVYNILNKINEIYRDVSVITDSSYLSNIISAVVKIAHGLSDLTVVAY